MPVRRSIESAESALACLKSLGSSLLQTLEPTPCPLEPVAER